MTRSGACDWLAAPLSLFCCSLMASRRCRPWACAVLLGRVWCGSCCGWTRSSPAAGGVCGTARPAGRSRSRQQRTRVHRPEDGNMSACLAAWCAWCDCSQPCVAGSQGSVEAAVPNKDGGQLSIQAGLLPTSVHLFVSMSPLFASGSFHFESKRGWLLPPPWRAEKSAEFDAGGGGGAPSCLTLPF